MAAIKKLSLVERGLGSPPSAILGSVECAPANSQLWFCACVAAFTPRVTPMIYFMQYSTSLREKKHYQAHYT